MTGDWQTWGAVAVVIAALALLLRAAFRPKTGGCGSRCGCAKPRPPGQK